MLNYIWLGLIVIAILVGLGRDIGELSEDKFRNNKPLELVANPGALQQTGPKHYTGTAYTTKQALAAFYDADAVKSMKSDTLNVPVDIITTGNTTQGTATLTLPEGSPGILSDLAAANGDATKIIGPTAIRTNPDGSVSALNFQPPAVYFRIMSKIANDGILKIADTAVTLALGLIGVMTLWLGIMKLAEAAGLVTMLAKLVKPLMRRLFPEVPSDHPAMGAMVMNMTANFLGLSNAATPLGLKAMEELNNLNPHAGTATNAMCMFLTINTTALTLIPATVIGIRLTLGSSNPSEIIMPTFLATVCSMFLSIFFTRFIERFYPLPKAGDPKPGESLPVTA